MSEIKKWLDVIAGIAKKNPKGRRFDELGRFYPDPTPLEVPLQVKPEPSIMDRIHDLVKAERARQEAEAAAFEDEDPDDYEIGDDWDPTSPYEEQFWNHPEAPKVPQDARQSEGGPAPTVPGTPASGSPLSSEPAAAPGGGQAAGKA